MPYQQAVSAVVRVAVVCLTVLALSIVGYGLGWYSLVVVMLVLVGVVLAMPAWSASITSRLWQCPHCHKPLPATFRYALVIPREAPFCPSCTLPLTPTPESPQA